MVEMRWIKSPGVTGRGMMGTEPGEHGMVLMFETVLQFREGGYEDTSKITGEDLWKGTNWTDVPFVKASAE